MQPRPPEPSPPRPSSPTPTPEQKVQFPCNLHPRGDVLVFGDGSPGVGEANRNPKRLLVAPAAENAIGAHIKTVACRSPRTPQAHVRGGLESSSIERLRPRATEAGSPFPRPLTRACHAVKDPHPRST